jgi:uncharacterized Zn finger protein
MFFFLKCPFCSESLKISIMQAAEDAIARCEKCGTSIDPITGRPVANPKPQTTIRETPGAK